MNIQKLGTATVAAIVLNAGAALAGCGITGGNISILANDFPALQAVVSTAETCAGDGIGFNKNHTAQHNEISVAAMSANPSEYTSKIVANSSIVPLLNDGLIRPLDDLVAKHGASLKPNQLIKIDGKIMAVAFMANAQHLFVRSDILEQVGKEAPTSYEDVLDVAKAIRDAGIMEYPFAALFKSDWNLGEEFVNMYLGHGGRSLSPAQPSLRSTMTQVLPRSTCLRNWRDIPTPIS